MTLTETNTQNTENIELTDFGCWEAGQATREISNAIPES